jgi:DNA-binding transcriptional MerR regulator
MNTQMMQSTNIERFPIRTVSELTGVNSVTLRAWERRYGLIKPLRTPKGHRLYTRDDIQLIQEILERLAAGASIGQIAREILDNAVTDDGDSDTWSRYNRQMIDAIVNFNNQALDAVYNDAMSLYPVDVVTVRLILPLLEELGSRWEKQTGSVAEEHFFSVYLRNKLGARFHHLNMKNAGPKLIVACLPGEHHEFGLLLFALMALGKGYQIILLGADLPIGDLHHVAAKTGCDGIVLSGSASLACEALYEDILDLNEAVSIPVFIGGDVANTCRDDLAQTGVYVLGHDLLASLYMISGRINKTD